MAEPDDQTPRPLRIDDEGQRYPIEKMTGSGRPRRASIRSIHEQSGRVPPQAVDVEQSVLGAMLIEKEAIPRAIEILTPDDFYLAKHQKIYTALLSLFERGNPADLITLTEELKRRGDLDDIGGAYYLTELTTQVASAANVEYHGRIIAEKSLLRKMIETMTLLVGQAYDPGSDAFELLDQAESDIFRISETQLRRPASELNEVLKDTLAHLEAIHGRAGGLTGVPSGFHGLDDLTGGWQRSDLIIIAARPSMGKTAIALGFARNAALHTEHPTGVAVFSLEMSAQQLAQRLLTSEARVNAQAARTGRLSDDDWPRLARAAGRLSAASIFIDDTPGLGILELRAKCRRLKAEHDIGLVIVDYLQLMHGSTGNRNANREQEIAQISRSLKSLAKELDVPVIALSQLNRAVETRGGDKRPQLSDLRESGCLTGESLIPLADSGKRVPIRDLAGASGFVIWALNQQTYKLERAVVSKAFSTGTKPVFKLSTQLGRHIHATGNHKFLTIKGWKRLDELRIGERMAVPNSTFYAGEERLAGGDGYASPEPEWVREESLGSVDPRLREDDLKSEGGRIAQVVASAPLKALAESDVYWDKIVSIEPDGVEEVFDLTVPGPHNFVANDVIAHNSIEQDADVVAFIYRAERYGITVDENGNSTEGLGEIIISKQRNGPIGNVQLAFVKEFARFENLTTYYAAPGSGGYDAGAEGYGAAPQPPLTPDDTAPF